MGASVDPANGDGTMAFSNLMRATPNTPALQRCYIRLRAISRAATAGAALAQPVVAA